MTKKPMKKKPKVIKHTGASWCPATFDCGPCVCGPKPVALGEKKGR